MFGNLALIGSGWVIPSNQERVKQIERSLGLTDLSIIYPQKIVNIWEGGEHRKWLVRANIGISNLLTNCMGEDIWFRELAMIQQVEV